MRPAAPLRGSLVNSDGFPPLDLAQEHPAMERSAYLAMAAHEAEHWWFVGRRAAIRSLLDRVPLPPDPRILEAGCGTGGNLYMLNEVGSVSAFEPNHEARGLAATNYPEQTVEEGELPLRIPFERGSFDLVVALDVVEHIQDDEAALKALVEMVRPGGWVLVTVPAIRLLWGSHDRRLHHVRRYDRSRLRAICDASGATRQYETYFNTILAPIAIAYRLGERLTGLTLGDQERLPPRLLNAFLARAFTIERHLVGRVPIPIGLSLAVILRR